MESKSSGDYFGSFLKSIQESTPAETPTANHSIKLMTTLASSGKTEVIKLMSESGLELAEFSDIIKQMQEKGLIEIDSSSGIEMVGLSAAAEQIVRAITFSQENQDKEEGQT
jgi:predicted transcriptional regulator